MMGRGGFEEKVGALVTYKEGGPGRDFRDREKGLLEKKPRRRNQGTSRCVLGAWVGVSL